MLSASNYLYFLQSPLIQQKNKQMQHLTAALQIAQRIAIHGQQELLQPIVQTAEGRQFLLQNRAVPHRISHLYIILSAARLPMGIIQIDSPAARCYINKEVLPENGQPSNVASK